VETLLCRVIEAIVFASWFVTKHDHRPGTIINLLKPWASILRIRPATKHSEEVYIWLDTIPTFIWCLALSKLLAWDLFRMNPVADAASPQNSADTFMALTMHLVALVRLRLVATVWLRLSTTSF
jgi:hypothetical protein